jgi:hypothetical protein
MNSLVHRAVASNKYQAPFAAANTGAGPFRVSNSAAPVTKGVDLVVLPPAPHGGSGSGAAGAAERLPALAFADTEGQGDTDVASDVNVFVPVLLASRVIVFNSFARGGAERNYVLSELAAMAVAASKVHRYAPGDASKGKKFGDLHIVFRDFALDNWDPDWHMRRIFGDADDEGELAGASVAPLSEDQRRVAAMLKTQFATIRGMCVPRVPSSKLWVGSAVAASTLGVSTASRACPAPTPRPCSASRAERHRGKREARGGGG